MIPEKNAPRLLGALFQIVIAASALGSVSCACRAADADASATAALSIPAESVPARETRVLMILAASSAGSTAKVARAIAEELGAQVVGPEQARDARFKALSGERNPVFTTILKVIGALGLKLHAEARRG